MKNKRVLDLIIKDLLTEVFLEIEKKYVILNENDGSSILKDLNAVWDWTKSTFKETAAFGNEVIGLFGGDSITIEEGQRFITVASTSSIVSTGASRLQFLGATGLPSHLINILTGFFYILGGSYFIAGAPGFSTDRKSYYLISGWLYIAIGTILMYGGFNAVKTLWSSTKGKGSFSNANLASLVHSISITIQNSFNKTAVTVKRAYEIGETAFKSKQDKFSNAINSGLSLRLFDEGEGSHIMRFSISDKAVITEKNGKMYLVVADTDEARLIKDELEVPNTTDLEPSAGGAPQEKPLNELDIQDLSEGVFTTRNVDGTEVATLNSNVVEIEINSNWKIVDTENDAAEKVLHSEIVDAINIVPPEFDSILGLESTKNLTREMRDALIEKKLIINRIGEVINNSTASQVSEDDIKIIRDILGKANIDADPAALTNFLRSNSRAQINDTVKSLSNKMEATISSSSNNKKLEQGIPVEQGSGSHEMIDVDAELAKRLDSPTIDPKNKPSKEATLPEKVVYTMSGFKALAMPIRLGFLKRMIKNLDIIQGEVRASLAAKPVIVKFDVLNEDNVKINTVEVEFYDFLSPGLFVGKISKEAEIAALNVKKSEKAMEVKGLKPQGGDIKFYPESEVAYIEKGVRLSPEDANAVKKYNAELLELNHIDSQIKMTLDLDKNSAFVIDGMKHSETADIVASVIRGKGPAKAKELTADLNFSRTWFAETAPDMGENMFTRMYASGTRNPGVGLAVRVSIPTISSVLSTDGYLGVGIDMSPISRPGISISDESSLPNPTIIYYPDASDMTDVKKTFGLQALEDKALEVESEKQP